MAAKFVLLASPRSGSTWVVDLLNSHSQLVMYSELFVNTGKEKPTFAGEKDILLWNAYYWRIPSIRRRLLRPYYTFRYLKQLYAGKPTFSPDTRGIGFKLMYGDMGRHRTIPFYLRANRIPVVHLVRRNYVDALVSMEVARKRNVFHSGDTAESVQLQLDPKGTRKKLDLMSKETDRFRKRLVKWKLPSIEIAYEDICAGQEPLDTAQEFLGLDPVPLNSHLRKLNAKSHSEVVENYEEVARSLEGTPYQAMLRP